ncbi:MAG: hypothetical protein WA667_01540, partial [Candidatus Nitrosopolaris sp.]
IQVQLSFYTYFLLYPFVITLQDRSVNHVRKLKCQPCMEAAQLKNGTRAVLYLTPRFSSSLVNLNIFVEKAGQASCIVITANGVCCCDCDISL